jgi:quercetin dioxygenase-like cupin family protein
MRQTRRAFLTLLGGAAGLLAACQAGPPPQATPAAKPSLAPAPPSSRSQNAPKPNTPPTGGKPADLWNGAGLEAKVLLQADVDQLPEGPFMVRVTELQMSPGATIDPHTHLGPGAQVVLAGAFTLIDGQTNAETVYQSTEGAPYPAFYTGMNWRYATANRGSVENHLFMTEILPQSRAFLGNQQFDTEGTTHNTGGVRSGPYLQTPLDSLPDGPLVVRVTLINMGSKAKTPEYIRPGPALFYVLSGQGTFRNEDRLSIVTTGAGGYYLETGQEPSILENKPTTPNRILAVEFLPASVGKGPSTIPTGREI